MQDFNLIEELQLFIPEIGQFHEETVNKEYGYTRTDFNNGVWISFRPRNAYKFDVEYRTIDYKALRLTRSYRACRTVETLAAFLKKYKVYSRPQILPVE